MQHSIYAIILGDLNQIKAEYLVDLFRQAFLWTIVVSLTHKDGKRASVCYYPLVIFLKNINQLYFANET